MDAKKREPRRGEIKNAASKKTAQLVIMGSSRPSFKPF
jgi:hypothetical protein